MRMQTQAVWTCKRDIVVVWYFVCLLRKTHTLNPITQVAGGRERKHKAGQRQDLSLSD